MPGGQRERWTPKDLSLATGLPLALDETGRLVFGPEMAPVEPEVRTFAQMRPLLLDPRAPGPADLYLMYRGLARAQDLGLFSAHRLRFDITVIRPGTLGREFVKTAGHYHSLVPGTTLSYPEVYQVVDGRALCLLQKAGQSGDEALVVVLVEAGPGQVVVVPPGYGHVTINPGPDPLVMSNLVEAEAPSAYDTYRRLGGAAYYVAQGPSGRLFIANRNYHRVGGIKTFPAASWPDQGLGGRAPLYTAFVHDPLDFRFLVHPERYLRAAAWP